jgi:penicillin-binding protein 1A
MRLRENRRTSRTGAIRKGGGFGRFVLRFFLGVLLFFVLVGAALFAWYEYTIVLHPGPEIDRERIQQIFTMESPVYYDDGQTVIGVFFHEDHRNYVPYEQMPRYFVHALLAAEDKNFFSHPGFDITGILRALYLNLKSGRVVQGGSSITQQTAKNLFKRQERSIKAKLVELIRALKLEAHYSKEQILEWYANQFYVSGNGRGVDIAAQYFFNKKVDELGLLECAFLAGSVKAPNRYNPFIQKDEKDRELALRRARSRTDYVLKNMLKLGFISQSQYEEALRQPIPFEQGRIRYPLNTILDEVRARLERPAIREALSRAGVENIATSGIKIYTSIRKELQEEAQSALGETLSVLETKLTGYDRDLVLERYDQLQQSDGKAERRDFAFGTVQEIRRGAQEPEILVALPGDRTGVVDRQGLQSQVAALVQAHKGPWAKPQKGDDRLILDVLQAGDPVFVRLRDVNEKGQQLLTLEHYPEINGGVLVVQDGFIRAMVGGMDNIHFNRALDARRQVGSVFKPLVYMAAVQLGWNNLDPLRNRRNAFLYQGRLYIPHPDHESPHEWVSMTWAGAKSENVATVWLLYHLCDRLSVSEAKQLARVLDMAPRRGEPRASYVSRIRDQLGILVNRDTLLPSAFEEARAELRTDLIFQGRTAALQSLDDLHYGLGVERYLKEHPDLEKPPYDKDEWAERHALFHNFQRLRSLQEDMRNDYEILRWALSHGDPTSRLPLAIKAKRRFYWPVNQEGQKVVYTYRPPGDTLVPIDPYWLVEQVSEGRDLEQIMPQEEIWVDGALPSGVLDQLQIGIQRRLTSLESEDPYSLDLLCRLRDFRTAMALRYVVYLAKEMGVLSPMEPVLSLPLGSNSVTLEDVSRLYYAFVTGKVFREQEDERPVTYLISRIEGPDGQALYEADPKPVDLTTTQQRHLVAEILRNVMERGTGHKANTAIHLIGREHRDLLKELNVVIPPLGKTGTSDEYRNSSFVGFLPGPTAGDGTLSLDNGVVLAAYVGYDDNRSMKNNRIRIFGSAGALPVWIKVAQAAVEYLDYENQLDLVDLTFRPGSAVPIRWPAEMVEVPVQPGSGLPDPARRQGPLARTYGSLKGERLELRRNFHPLQEERKES